jgi:ribonuclease HI
MAAKWQEIGQGQSSSEPNGDRRVWDLVWKADVPQKVRIFAWRAATGSLAVKHGLHRRISTIDPVCSICGTCVEDDHHALITCTIAKALRHELRTIWSLPDEVLFNVKGKEWLLHLLSNATKEMRPKILFLLWRTWHHRNNIVHGDGKASVSASVSFLASYLTSFAAIHAPVQNTICDKKPSWSAPTLGSLKANVDAGWDAHSKVAGLGIIVRDSGGNAVVSEWKHVSNCGSAEEAEILACLQGLKHLIDLRQWPATVESDCLRAVQALSSSNPENSTSWALVLEGRELLSVYRELRISKVDRINNSIAHVLAQLGKAGISGSLSYDAPDCIKEMIISEMM